MAAGRAPRQRHGVFGPVGLAATRAAKTAIGSNLPSIPNGPAAGSGAAQPCSHSMAQTLPAPGGTRRAKASAFAVR